MKKIFTIKRSTKHKGQIIVLVALAMVGLAAAVGLVTDATVLYITRQNLQRAIDASVQAASRKLPDRPTAEGAAYEIMRLHGYDFNPTSKPLTFTYPAYTPPRKTIAVQATTPVEFFFLKIINWQGTNLTASAEAESAPLDVYLVIDLSVSMVYDTARPSQSSGYRSRWDNCNNDFCRADVCNDGNFCNPLDTYIKPAARHFVDLMSSQYDRIGLVVYDRQGSKKLALTDNFAAVKTAIDNMDAYEGGVSGNTNTGDGIMYAHDAIAAEGRMDAVWSMVLLTDGRANVYRSGSGCGSCPSSCGSCTSIITCSNVSGCTQAENWAINHARDTWNRHETVIYTIAYGDIFQEDPDYKELMVRVADITDNGVENGTTENFWEAPDHSALVVALEEIAERIFTRLLR